MTDLEPVNALDAQRPWKRGSAAASNWPLHNAARERLQAVVERMSALDRKAWPRLEWVTASEVSRRNRVRLINSTLPFPERIEALNDLSPEALSLAVQKIQEHYLPVEEWVK